MNSPISSHKKRRQGSQLHHPPSKVSSRPLERRQCLFFKVFSVENLGASGSRDIIIQEKIRKIQPKRLKESSRPYPSDPVFKSSFKRSHTAPTLLLIASVSLPPATVLCKKHPWSPETQRVRPQNAQMIKLISPIEIDQMQVWMGLQSPMKAGVDRTTPATRRTGI